MGAGGSVILFTLPVVVIGGKVVGSQSVQGISTFYELCLSGRNIGGVGGLRRLPKTESAIVHCIYKCVRINLFITLLSRGGN